MIKEEKLESYEVANFKYRDIIKRFLKCIRQYKKDTILSIIFIVLETLLECIIPFIMSLLINTMTDFGEGDVATNDFLPRILMYAGILLGLAIVSLLCGIFAGRFSARASVGYARNVREDIFNKLTTFSFKNIDKFSIPSLVTRQTTDVFYIQLAFMMIIRVGLRGPLMLIFSIIMAAIMAPNMAWIYAITVPVLAIALILIIYFVTPIFLKVFKKYDRLNESINENVRGIRVVKTYVREEYEKEKFKNASQNVMKGFIKAERLIALTNPLMYITMYLSMSLIISFGSLTILNGITNGETSGFNVGQMSALITYGAQILSSLMMLSMVFFNVAFSIASMKRVYEVLIEEPTIKNKENAIKEVKTGDIEFNNVNFKYKDTAKNYALSDINIKIKEGEMIGIIGGTGSSKSTLVNLISRFYDTTTGEVKVGGVNVKDYDLVSLRNQVSMVLQKNVLFSGTIAENLRWGNKNATDEEIAEACKIAQCDSFIRDKKDGYNCIVLQGGSNFSGGQKQRLCIARAILKKPKILILDDSTSAVDTKTDAYIRSGLRKTLPNTTKIIIAQRVSSVMDADKIIVLDNGKISGIGNHEELLKTNDIYKEIFDIQNQIGGNQNA